MFVVDARDRTLVRSRLVSIEGTSVERALELVEPLTPADNAWNTRGMAPHYLLTAEVLDGLGVVDGAGPATFTFERPGGQRADVDADPDPGPSTRGRSPIPSTVTTRPCCPAAASALPLRRGQADVGAEGRVRARRVRRLQLGRLALARVRAVADTTRTGAEGPSGRRRRSPERRRGQHDLRRAHVALRVARRERRGKLYVLIGRATFSAAANFAAELDRDTRAIFVGEPTGGGVETYGDTFPVTLPTLGWKVYIAAEYLERKRSASDKRLAVGADLRVDLTSEQYFAGRDPVLERALKGL